MVWLFKQSLTVTHQNRVPNNPQFSWTFHMNTYICEQCQEGQKLTVEGHFFNEINPLIGRAWGPLIAVNCGLG